MHLKDKLHIYLHSFQLRVFFALTLIILIVIPTTGYLCFIKAREVVQRQMQQYSLGAAAQISKRVESFLSKHTDNAKLIKSFFENGLIPLDDDKEILKYFYLFKQDKPEFVNINFGDETGRFLMAPAQIPEVHKIFDPRVRPWYRGAIETRGVHWTDVYLFASTLKPGMTVSVPVYDKTQTVRAICGIDIDISSFSRFLEGIKIGTQGVAYIFENKQGRVIAHPSLAKLPWDPMQIDLLRACLNDLNKKNASFGMSSFEGKKYFTAYTDYPGNDWTVGVTLPVFDFMENIIDIKRAIITLVLLGILFSSLLSYLLAKTIVSPLNILKKGIERISKGDLAHKVDISDPDIAAELAAEFNQMASSLETSTRQLKETYAELAQKEKLAAVGQMTAVIAHEIKNPLGIILGSAQVVANKDRPMEMREKAAAFIMDEVDRLNRTLSSFLEFARPASPDLRKVNIIDLLEEILASTRESLTMKGYHIQVKLPDAQPKIYADAEQLKQVFWNILLNAVQSMPDGGTIMVTAGLQDIKDISIDEIMLADGSDSEDQTALFISVNDAGCGLSEKQIRKITDPFISFRDDGTGLGLAIVSQIIKAHKGSLTLQTQLGKGSRFKLLLPALSEEMVYGG